jgi:hypothetical protein
VRAAGYSVVIGALVLCALVVGVLVGPFLVSP